MRSRALLLTVVSLLVLGLAGCGGDGGSSDGETPDGALAGLEVDGEIGQALDVRYDGKVSVDRAESEDLTVGDGNPVQLNGAVLVHLYIGNGSTGKQAFNTYDQGRPVQVRMSDGQFFKPVLDAVIGKNRGSRVAVAAPVKDVWGPQGAPQFQLKPKDTAVFVADVVSVEPTVVLDGPQGQRVDPPQGAPGVEEKGARVVGLDWSDAPKKAPSKLQVIPLVKGDGPPAKAQSMVTFDYFGAVYGDEKPFDESYRREPVPFGVGVHALIPAWDKVIPGLTRGSRVLIIAPPDQGYGDQSRPGIPANSTLVFVVDVLGVDG